MTTIGLMLLFCVLVVCIAWARAIERARKRDAWKLRTGQWPDEGES